MKLSVIYSFYNEAENLPELIRRTRTVMRDRLKFERGEYELIFVNDRSTDESLNILQGEMSSGDIRVINTTRTFGNAACGSVW